MIPSKELFETVTKLSQTGKGILAADESTNTIGKRFTEINVSSTADSRRDYREMLFATEGLGEYISGVILFDETIQQKTEQGLPLNHVLSQQNIVLGIKVDSGLVNLPTTDNEKVTQGLDNLHKRLEEYYQLGARFAKWRAVFNITDIKPSSFAIRTNAVLLARYAAICQAANIVPIVEPEVLTDGSHNIERCQVVTETVLHEVFHQLHLHKVLLEGMILKPNMVTPGASCVNKSDATAISSHTVTTLLRTVPAAVPSINFLSGGQSAECSTENLSLMNQNHPNLPWNLSFSYGRALQAPSLTTWAGKKENIAEAQALLLKRSRLNGLAAVGKYQSNME